MEEKIRLRAVGDKTAGAFSLCRFHIPEPILFENSIRVRIDQIGGAMKETLLDVVDDGAQTAKTLDVQNTGSARDDNYEG